MRRVILSFPVCNGQLIAAHCFSANCLVANSGTRHSPQPSLPPWQSAVTEHTSNRWHAHLLVAPQPGCSRSRRRPAALTQGHPPISSFSPLCFKASAAAYPPAAASLNEHYFSRIDGADSRRFVLVLSFRLILDPSFPTGIV
jgi:hypothetical protein